MDCLLPFYSETFILLSPLKNFQNKIYITIILLVLYGCESWCLILKEEHRFRMFKNRVLRRIFGPKREKVS